MNKIVEVLLTVLALVGLFCAAQMNTPNVATQHSIVVADGSDPMPICRNAKRCC